MADQKTFVDGTLFLGRNDEQTRFRQALDVVLNAEAMGRLPPVFLIRADDGMGKSTLIRRLRDIASHDPEFGATTQTMLLDWELERYRSMDLKVPRQEITAATVFDHLYQAARDVGWGHQFSEYQKVVRTLSEAEKKIAEVLDQECWGNRYRAIRGLGANDLAILIRDFSADGEGRTNSIPDTLGRICRGGPESLALAKKQADDWLEHSAQLESNEANIFRNPDGHLGRALGVGFSKISQIKPLVLLMDSFEIVDHVDAAIRGMIKAAGPRVIWVVARTGRAAADEDEEFVAAFEKEFDESLVVFRLMSLNRNQVAEFIHDRAPDRLLTPEDADTIAKMTRGIPLALRITADLWAGGVTLPAMAGSVREPRSIDELLYMMSELLVIHCDDPDDRLALMLLAIQRRPDEAIQTGVLRKDDGPFELDEALKRLTIRYSTVRVTQSAFIHSKIAAFIRRFLLRRRIRMGDEVKVITARATAVIAKIRERLEAGFPRLEDRFDDNEWREAMTDTIYWMFWHNEFNAWRNLTRTLVDSLAYDPALAKTLLKIADQIRPLLSKNGIGRFKILKRGVETHFMVPSVEQIKSGANIEVEEAMFVELETWLTRYGGKDLYAIERRAILDLCRGQMYYRNERHAEALKLFLQADRNMPPQADYLSKQLATSLETVGDGMAWRQNGSAGLEAIPSRDAEVALKKALSLGRRRAKIYHTLGAVQDKMGKVEAALENLLQAVTLNPATEVVWQNLGDVYRKQDRCEKAVPAYRRAIELSQDPLRARLDLAICYRRLEQKEDFEKEIKQLGDQVGNADAYLQACFAAIVGRTENSIELLKVALEKDQISKTALPEEPAFEEIRMTPAFQELLRS